MDSVFDGVCQACDSCEMYGEATLRQSWPHRPSLVLIEWVDSNRYPHWTEREDLVRSGNEGMLRCRSAGWLVHETDDLVMIANSQSANDHYCLVMEIPKLAITRRVLVMEG